MTDSSFPSFFFWGGWVGGILTFEESGWGEEAEATFCFHRLIGHFLTEIGKDIHRMSQQVTKYADRR